MGSRVTIKDIARSTGTSVASVHRALHGGSGVGEGDGVAVGGRVVVTAVVVTLVSSST